MSASKADLIARGCRKRPDIYVAPKALKAPCQRDTEAWGLLIDLINPNTCPNKIRQRFTQGWRKDWISNEEPRCLKCKAWNDRPLSAAFWMPVENNRRTVLTHSPCGHDRARLSTAVLMFLPPDPRMHHLRDTLAGGWQWTVPWLWHPSFKGL